MCSKGPLKISLRYFRVVWEQKDGLPVLAPKVNHALSKATERNRIKRILREFFRKHKERMQGGNWIFIARPAAEKAANREIFLDLEGVFGEARQ